MHPTRRGPTVLYRLYDAEGVLLYVGVTSNQKARWANHKREKSWWPEVAHIAIEWHATRSEALSAEKQAVATEGPRYNSIHNPEREAAARERLQSEALRWARGTGSEPYPDDATWADVASDLTLLQVHIATSKLHLAGVKTPPELTRRLQELLIAETSAA